MNVSHSDLRSRETTESLDEEGDYRRDFEQQAKYYNTLVNEGGRPSHPVSLGRDNLEDPGEYREILSYWQLVNHDAEGRVWKVFGSQMCEWKRFAGGNERTERMVGFLNMLRG
jgi:hypothetical protein